MSTSENQFGKYELVARLAAGGMAEIFKARFSPAAGVTKQVVIKRILPHYAANKAFIAMFTNEAKIAMSLSHGNIAQVFDFGDIDGEWFLAMELVDGQPLSKLMRRARTLSIPFLPEAYGVAIAIELLKGLHYAHTRTDEHGKPLKIVHRDVSPQNVLVSYRGEIKIVDFGIAKARELREDPSSGPVKGKYIYFSPEQARGKELDPRTDVFAAGIVLYEMICGQLPFNGKMIEVLSKLVRGEFPKPREVNPDLTPDIEQILLKALANDRNQRYESAEAFELALVAHLRRLAPTFKQQHLSNLMSLLFEEELVKEGRPVQIPREFSELAHSWKRDIIEVPPEDEEPPRLPAPIIWDSDDNPLGTREMMSPEPRMKRPLKLFGAFALAAIFAVVGVFGWAKFSVFSLKVESTPPGAAIILDGQPTQKVTPATLKALKASGPHTLSLSLEGYKKFEQQVEPERGVTVDCSATLEREPPKEPVKPAEPKQPELVEAPPKPPPEPEVAVSASWPVAEVTVSARTHVYSVPASSSARVRLDPKHSYKVWTEGKVTLGASPKQVGDCVYFLESAKGGTAKDSFGVLGPRPVVVKNATALHAWFADQKPEDGRGQLKVKLTDLTTKQTAVLMLDARANAFAPPKEQRFTLSNLIPGDAFEVKLRDGKPAAQTLGASGGEVRKVLLGLIDAQGAEEGRVLEVGKPVRFKGVKEAWVSIPDDGREDNSGALVLEVKQTN
jgi:serine/threonine protein kinase